MTLDLPTLVALLREAREYITDKPWDDNSRLHDRISDALGLPRHYPHHPRNNPED